MKITIYGAGYVGLVTAACFAELGNQVLCVDIDSQRIVQLQLGECPIHEPGLAEMLISNAKAGRLAFTSDTKEGVDHGAYQFIAVGTPSDSSGAADLQYVLAVAESIGQHLNKYCIVINKSTVPVGTANQVKQAITEALQQRAKPIHFDIVSNPEFLRQGAAIKDFMNSDRIIIGVENDVAEGHMQTLYSPLNRNHDRVITMDLQSAELTKYAANAFLATKISFINELSNLADGLGADIEKVRIGIGSDPRIGYHFIQPGCGFGGSCFPKDVAALQQMAIGLDYQPKLISAVHQVNINQKSVLFHKINRYFGYNLVGKTIALWGLAFKPNTDDMREAPSRTLIEALWQAGAKVQAFDPVAMPQAQKIYGKNANLILTDDLELALVNADALAIVTEWNVFASPDFSMIKQKLHNPVIFDGRNLYDPDYMKKAGFQYYAIGRGERQYPIENLQPKVITNFLSEQDNDSALTQSEWIN